MMKLRFLVLLAAAVWLGGASAGAASSPADRVLAQESRWLSAIVAGDKPTVDAILAPTFMHTTAEGKLITRARELAETQKLPLTMKATQQNVDIVGNVAIVRGVNTITEKNAVERVRFTDVFINANGAWLALSAQESPMR